MLVYVKTIKKIIFNNLLLDNIYIPLRLNLIYFKVNYRKIQSKTRN